MSKWNVTMRLPRRFLPSIPALQALEAVDRLGSATAAARELSLTQGAVSRQLKALETQLGIAILRRSGKRLRLTEPGAAYAAEIRGALNRIAEASLKLTANPGGGAVNLAILPSFGMRWLVPRLPRFAAAHPDVTINMTTRIERFSFAMQLFDAAITYGDGMWPDTERLKLAGERLVAVARPALLDGAGIRTGADLLRLPLLHIRSRPDAWARWFAARGVTAQMAPGMVHDQFATIVQAALHGLGVALLPDYLVAQDLAAGRLVRALDNPREDAQEDGQGAYWLVWPRERARDPALAAFRAWLAAEAGADSEDMLPR